MAFPPLLQGTGGRGAAAGVDTSPAHGCQGREGAVPAGDQLHRLCRHSSVGALCTLLPCLAALHGAAASQQSCVCCSGSMQRSGSCPGTAQVLAHCEFVSLCTCIPNPHPTPTTPFLPSTHTSTPQQPCMKQLGPTGLHVLPLLNAVLRKLPNTHSSGSRSL